MVLETQAGFFIGPLFIYYYGIVYAVAALALYVVLLRKRKELGLNEAQVDTFVISVLLGLLIGGRIFHFLINDPSVFIHNPLQLFLIREGGMSFFGAFVGMIGGAWIWYKRIQKNNIKGQKSIVDSKLFLQLLDYGCLVGSVALIFGRIANFLNQELVGRIADPNITTWCIEFATAAGCRHPYQLYAAASHVILALSLFSIVLCYHILSKKSEKKKKTVKKSSWPEGIILFAFMTGYGILRFITDFWRDDAIVLLGLTIWQILSLLLAIVGAFFLCRLLRRTQI